MTEHRGFDGIGRQHGPLRPDWSPGWAELRCDRCSASWIGPVDEPCAWCALAHRRVLEHQAEIVLRQPDIDPGDARYSTAMKGWADRMVTAVRAGIVDRDAVDRAWRRAVRRAA